jgi:hypothetical protein
VYVHNSLENRVVPRINCATVYPRHGYHAGTNIKFGKIVPPRLLQTEVLVAKTIWLAHDRADEFRRFAPDHAFWATVLQTVAPIAPSNSRFAFSFRLRAA